MTIGVTRTTRAPLGISLPTGADPASRSLLESHGDGGAEFSALIARAAIPDRPTVSNAPRNEPMGPHAAPSPRSAGTARAAERRRLEDTVQRASTPVGVKHTAHAEAPAQQRAVVKETPTPAKASQDERASVGGEVQNPRASSESRAASADETPGDDTERSELAEREVSERTNARAAETQAVAVSPSNVVAPTERESRPLDGEEWSLGQGAEGVLDPRGIGAQLSGPGAAARFATAHASRVTTVPSERGLDPSDAGLREDAAASAQNAELSGLASRGFDASPRGEALENALHAARIGLGSHSTPIGTQADTEGTPSGDATGPSALGKSGRAASRTHGGDAHSQTHPTTDEDTPGLRAARLESERLREAAKPADHARETPKSTERSGQERTSMTPRSSADTPVVSNAAAGAEAGRANTPSRDGTTKATAGQTTGGAPQALGVARTVGPRHTTTTLRIGQAESTVHEFEQLARARRQEAATSVVNQLTLRQGAEGVLDLGELGTVRVSARAVAGEVDIDIRAQDGDTASILQSASGLLEAELRRESIDVRQLGIEKEQRDGDEKGKRHRDERQPEERPNPENHDPSSEFDAELETSVRFVL